MFSADGRVSRSSRGSTGPTPHFFCVWVDGVRVGGGGGKRPSWKMSEEEEEEDRTGREVRRRWRKEEGAGGCIFFLWVVCVCEYVFWLVIG